MALHERHARLRLGPAQLVVVVATLTTIAAIVWALGPYDWRELYVGDVLLPRMQATHGFTWGTVTFDCDQIGPAPYKGVLDVAPDGRFAHIGIRAGDVPWERHGHGAAVLHDALAAADRGLFVSIDLANAWDCREGKPALRIVVLHPRVREVPGSLGTRVLPAPAGSRSLAATAPTHEGEPYRVWLIDDDVDERRVVWSYSDFATGTWSSDGRWLALTDAPLAEPSRCILLRADDGTLRDLLAGLSALPQDQRPRPGGDGIACEIVGWVRDEPARLAVSVFAGAPVPGEPWRFDYYVDIGTARVIPAGMR